MRNTWKRMMALVIAVMMVMAVGMPVFAADPVPGEQAATETVTIKVTRDTDTYEGEADADSRNFTWYRVFTATYGSDFTGNTSGGGYDDDGTPGTVTGDTEHAVAYVASAAVAAKMGEWVPATYYAEGDELPEGKKVGDLKEAAHWDPKSTGNTWFTLTPIAGSDPAEYNVTWSNANTDADTVQAAAKWILEKAAYDAHDTLEFSGSGNTAAWSAEVEKGYYVLSSEAGDNLIAATTDIEVKEKNDYPPLDKTQADEDDTTQSDAARDVAVGDVLTYEVKVTIPKTAKVGDKIVVWDKASTGLTYNNDVEVKSNEASASVTPGTKGSNYTGTGTNTAADWNQLIEVTANSQGKDVVFTFTMTVNSDALTDTDKANESGLKYGRGSGETPFPYESTPDKVEYKTYFAGIEKVDGDNPSTKLAGVKFTLKEGVTEFKVSKPEGKDYYIPDASGSSEVVTATDGTIKIRGLDDDKTYTLTETENPNAGYNMLAEPVTLTLHEDTTGSITYAVATTYDASATYYTKSGDTYTAAGEVSQETFDAAAQGTYYTKTESSTSAYEAATADTWQDVLNYKGTVLPSTGGFGTTLFYIVGTILVIGAGVLLVTRRRMSFN